MALRFAAGGIMIPLDRPLVRRATAMIGWCLRLVCGLGELTGGASRGLALAVVASEAVMATCFSMFVIAARFRGETPERP